MLKQAYQHHTRRDCLRMRTQPSMCAKNVNLSPLNLNRHLQLLEHMHACNRVLIVSNGVVMHDAVAPAKIPPAAWTITIVP